jgi:ribosomal protein S18 acetylase RimI-like enzyme
MRVTPTDAIFEQVWTIHVDSFPKGELAPKGMLKNIFDNGTVFVRYSEVDGSVLSYAILSDKHDEPYVWSIATKQCARGQGHADWLLYEMEQYVRDTTVATGMWLCVHVNNAAAQRLYLAKGFRVTKCLMNFYGHGEMGLAMRKTL